MKPYNIEKVNGEDVAVRNDAYWKKKELEKFELFMKKAGIPKNYWDLDFKDYEGIRSIESKSKCEQYALQCREEKFHNVNLYLVGNHSAQKSMCACAIGKEFIRQGLKVKFVYAGELIDLLLKNQGFSFIEEFYSELRQTIDVDLLIIDDIFDSQKSVYWQKNPDIIIAAWDTFLRSFIHADKRIILTSNFSVEAIKEKFGESVYQLVSRDFIQLLFYDDIKDTRKKRFKNLWDWDKEK